MTYKYDVFISYRRYREWPKWVREQFLPAFKHWLGEELADWLDDRDISIFFDEDMETGIEWPQELGDALSKSRILVTLWSGQYFNSRWCLQELATMLEREKQCGVTGLVLPAVIHDGDRFPDYARKRNWIDLSNYADIYMTRDSPLATTLSIKIKKWTKDIRKAIEKAPVYDPSWGKITLEEFSQIFEASTRSKQTHPSSLE